MNPVRPQTLPAIAVIAAGVLPSLGRIVLIYFAASRCGASVQGVFAHATTLAAMVAYILGSGIQTSNTYLISRNPNRYSSMCCISSAIYALAIMPLFAATLLGLMHLFPGYFDGYPAAFKVLIPLLTCGNLLYQLGNGVLLGLRRYRTCLLVALTQTGVTVGLVMGMVVMGKLTLLNLLITYALGFGAALALTFWSLWQSREVWERNLHGVRKLLVVQFWYGLKVTLSGSALSLVFRLDLLLLRAFTSFEIVGLYSMAASVSELILHLPKGASTYLLSYFTRTRRTPSGSVRIYAGAFIAMSVGAIIVAIGVTWLPDILNQPEYVACLPYVFILLPGSVSMGMGLLFASHLNSLNQPQRVTFAALAALVVTIFGNILLTWHWGAIGTSVVSAVAYTSFGLVCGVQVVVLWRRTQPSNLLGNFENVVLIRKAA